MRGGAGVKPTRERRPCRAFTCLREPFLFYWAYWQTKDIEVRYGRHSASRTRHDP